MFEKVPRTLKLGIADNGGQFHVQLCDKVIVSLPENPGAGESWSNDTTNDVVRAIGETFETGTGGVGTGGFRVFKFAAEKAGISLLCFTYFSPSGQELLQIRFRLFIS